MRNSAVFQRLRASWVYDAYWRARDARIIDKRDREVSFYRRLLKGLRPSDLVFDIGANHGAKTDMFLRLGARVIAVEPDETNQRILNDKFLRYRFRPRPVQIVGKAVAEKSAVGTMWVDEPGSAKNTLSRKWVATLREDESRFGHRLSFGQERTVETVTLDLLVDTYGAPFFIKIDVEGFEPSVLRGLHRTVPFVSFEVNLPEFRPEGLECVRLLHRLDPSARFNYMSDNAQDLRYSEWMPFEAFLTVLEQCSEKSVEVFWAASAPAR